MRCMQRMNSASLSLRLRVNPSVFTWLLPVFVLETTQNEAHARKISHRRKRTTRSGFPAIRPNLRHSFGVSGIAVMAGFCAVANSVGSVRFACCLRHESVSNQNRVHSGKRNEAERILPIGWLYFTVPAGSWWSSARALRRLGGVSGTRTDRSSETE